MPRPKGLPKTGGRKPGSKTKLSKEVASRLNEMGCDPAAGLARLAMSTEKTEPKISSFCYGKLMEYVYPKLSAIDHRLVDAEGKDRSLLDEFDRMVEMASGA